VVGVVLGVVVLHQKRGALNPVVVPLARLESPRPGEVDFLFARLLNGS